MILVPFLDLAVLSHVVEPQEESDETNDDQELVEPKPEERHESKDALKEVAEEVPECVHLSLFSAHKYRRNSESATTKIRYFYQR